MRRFVLLLSVLALFSLSFTACTQEPPPENMPADPAALGAPLGGQGITTNDQIYSTWDWLFYQLTEDEKLNVTYSDIVERLGDDGLSIENENNAEPGHINYLWRASDSESVIRIEFVPVDNGEFTYYKGDVELF